MTNVFARGGHKPENSLLIQKTRNGKVDFLKFIFSVVIVVHHGKNVVGTRDDMFLSGGSFAVEFFFIVSGFLLMASISKIKTAPTELGKETRNFIIRKYKSFCPEIFVAYAIALLFYSTVNQTQFFDLFVLSFFEGTMLRMTGIHATSINSAVWYISSMLLCMMIMYPLIRKFPDMSVNVVLPLSALLLLGYFCGNGRSPRAPTEWMDWTYRGNLRAFAELSIGVCCYKICEHIKKIRFTKSGRCLLTIIEYLCYFALLYYMYFYKASRRDYFFILVYAVAIIITFSEKTIDTGFYNNELCYFLGKYSFSLYLSHAFFSMGLKNVLPTDLTNTEKMISYLLCSALTGYVVMCMSNVIRKYNKSVLSKLRELLIVKISV